MTKNLNKEAAEELSVELEDMELEPENIEGETRNEAFLRLVNKRLPVAVKRLRLIGNLASGNYDYTPEQAEQVMTVLREELHRLNDAFNKVKAEDSVPTIG